MNSKIAIQRIKQGIEKQDTNSYANFTNWDFEDALNKGLSDWFRRQNHGTNAYREGEEESEMRVDDLQVFLTEKKMAVTNYKIYSDSIKLPSNYRYYNKLSLITSKGDCKNVLLPSKLVENSNTDELLADWTSSPSFEFEQAFHSMLSNKFRLFHNDEFEIEYIKLSYYRAPQLIKCDNSSMDLSWEIKDDVAELIIDEAIKNLAGNIEHSTATQLAKTRVEENN